jgi:DNA-binding NarL/FixJ family response regulator
LIGIAVVASTPALRAGLRALLSAPGLDVLGEAAGLADLALSGMAGVTLLVLGDERALADLPDLLAEGHRPAVVALAESAGAAAALRDLPLPGWGLVAPDAPAATLHAAVQAAAAGLTVLPARLAAELLAGRAALEPLALPTEGEPLTPREREVLDLLAEGLANKAIARRLNISEHTVKFHIGAIYDKLDVSSRTEAVRQGAHRGLITL